MDLTLDLKDKYAQSVLNANDIADTAERQKRPLTADEQTTIENHLKDAEGFKTEIDRLKSIEETMNRARTERDNIRRPATRVVPGGDTSPEPKTAKPVAIVPQRRCGPLRAFIGPDSQKAERDAYESGMYMVSELFRPGHPMKDIAHRWCEQNGTYQQIRDALGTNVPASGGALVPDAMTNTIIDLRETYGIARQWAEVMPMSSDSQIVPRRVGSPTASFIGENTAITESESTFNNITFTAKKLAILERISTEISEDSIIALADYLTRDMAWAFALKEDQCLFIGDGSATYGGITGLTQIVKQSAHSASYIDVATATHNTFPELDATDLTTLMASLPQYARAGGKGCAWFASQYGAELTFNRLKATAGGNTILTLSAAGITAMGQRGVVGEYLGYPIVVSQTLPSTGTLTSTPMLAFGNLSLAATIADRRAISFATDPSRYFDQDQIALRCTERVDIILHDMGDTSTAGPIVVLKAGTS